MRDLVDREELLRTLMELSPACREPQVFIANNSCNCWSGISEAMKVIQEMKGARHDN